MNRSFLHIISLSSKASSGNRENVCAGTVIFGSFLAGSDDACVFVDLVQVRGWSRPLCS